jgi:branched-chain amino acid transport system permease protein
LRSPAALLAASAALVAALLALGLVLPNWLLFLVTLAASHGIVSLGIVLLMRGGVVSFGQGLVFAVGGYAVALAVNRLGLTEAPVLILLAAAASGLVGAAAGPLLSRYSGIFFGMLTLALSMVLYGVLIKSTALGGSDGFNIPRPTLLGRRLDGAGGDYALYALTVGVTGVVSFLAALYIRSVRGLMSLAVQANALRVEYLGASARAVTTVNFVLAAVLGGMGGALTVLALGHIEPDFAFWTRSGEFVFVAILAGPQSVVAVFVSSLVLELVRSFSNLYFPNTWQMALGLFLLAVILFLPRGIGSLWAGRRSPRSNAATVLEARGAPAE